jgi:hypothetical protein
MIVFRTDLLFFTVITSFTASAGEYLSYFQEGPIFPIFPATGAGVTHAGGFAAPREWKLHDGTLRDFIFEFGNMLYKPLSSASDLK